MRDNYTKREVRIAMRDGTQLFTSIYSPRDTSQKWPILLRRSPYSVAPYGEDKFPETIGPGDLFAPAKYIFAFQDVRGAYMSEGQFVDMRPELASRRNSPAAGSDSNGSAASRGASDPNAKAFDESTDTWDTTDPTSLYTNLPVAVRVDIQMAGRSDMQPIEIVVPIDSQSRTNMVLTAQTD